MKTWKCDVCGTEVQGENPPDKCPKCGSGPEHFHPLED